jgi:hypothetical protein
MYLRKRLGQVEQIEQDKRAFSFLTVLFIAGGAYFLYQLFRKI